MKKMINTIIFDLGEVYLKGFKGVENYLEPILGIDTEKIRSILEGEELRNLFRGKITEEEYWKKIIKKGSWEIDVKSLKKFVRKNFEEIQGTREIIEKLKEKGFKLGLLSVHTKEWIEYCNKKFDYHRLFNSVLYSFDVGLGKLDKKIYKLILKKLDSKSEECIFIDDNPKYLASAKELGINIIHFENPNKLKEKLINFGIKI